MAEDDWAHSGNWCHGQGNQHPKPKNINRLMTNHLYYGDNLEVLRENIAAESVDLIYLDPPFNSQASYNVLFRSPTGEQSKAQIEAFEDTWHWNNTAERAFDEVIQSGNTDAAEMLRAMRSFLKENDMMAYLTMMAVRLLELHRALKQSGSIYLHCDSTASHYLKILLDAIFGPKNFRNDLVWKRVSTVKGNFGQGSKFLAPTRTIYFSTRNPINIRLTRSSLNIPISIRRYLNMRSRTAGDIA
jgi:site-specific DNA-methyltransferase (adenine-specific)